LAPRRYGRTGYGQWVLASLMAQPEEGGQVRNMVGMKMADGDQRQVAKFCLGLVKPKEGSAARVDKNPRLSADPKEVTSVVSHAVCSLSKTALARRYLAMMFSALAVQTKGLGFWL
jgi:hypothetical protein